MRPVNELVARTVHFSNLSFKFDILSDLIAYATCGWYPAIVAYLCLFTSLMKTILIDSEQNTHLEVDIL